MLYWYYVSNVFPKYRPNRRYYTILSRFVLIFKDSSEILFYHYNSEIVLCVYLKCDVIVIRDRFVAVLIRTSQRMPITYATSIKFSMNFLFTLILYHIFAYLSSTFWYFFQVFCDFFSVSTFDPLPCLPCTIILYHIYAYLSSVFFKFLIKFSMFYCVYHIRI